MELATVQTASQRSFGLQTIHRGTVHRLVETLGPVPTPHLGLVHRGIRITQQRLRRAGAVPDHIADTHRDVHELAVDLHSARDLAADPIGQHPRLAFVVDRGAQHDEFVAAETGDRILRANQVGEPSRHRQEHLVTRVVPTAVVDDLETVQVDEQQRQLPVVTTTRLNGGPEPFEQQAAVGKPGERVVGGQVPQLAVRVPQLGDVVQGPHVHDRAAVTVGDRAGAQLDPTE